MNTQQHWQPIETAPKDGTRILLLIPGSREHGDVGGVVELGQYHIVYGWETYYYETAREWGCQYNQPTHWAPFICPAHPTGQPK